MGLFDNVPSDLFANAVITEYKPKTLNMPQDFRDGPQSPATYRPRPKSKRYVGLPRPGYGEYSEPILDQAGEIASDIVDRSDEERRAAIDAALGELDLTSSRIRDLFSGTRSDIESELPLNPFTDELRESRRTAINDQILREVQNALGGEAYNLSQRGVQGGGATGGASALVQGGAISGRAAVANALRDEQFRTNQQRAELRQRLLGSLTEPQSRFEAGIGDLRARLERGDELDISIPLSILSGLTEGEIGVTQAEKDRALALELGESLDPSLANIALDFGQSYATGQGNPLLAAIFGSGSRLADYYDF